MIKTKSGGDQSSIAASVTNKKSTDSFRSKQMAEVDKVDIRALSGDKN